MGAGRGEKAGRSRWAISGQFRPQPRGDDKGRD